jgi:hypothetical protein
LDGSGSCLRYRCFLSANVTSMRGLNPSFVAAFLPSVCLQWPGSWCQVARERCTDRWQACRAYSLDVIVEVAVGTAVVHNWLRVQGRWRAEVLDDAVCWGSIWGSWLLCIAAVRSILSQPYRRIVAKSLFHDAVIMMLLSALCARMCGWCSPATSVC